MYLARTTGSGDNFWMQRRKCKRCVSIRPFSLQAVSLQAVLPDLLLRRGSESVQRFKRACTRNWQGFDTESSLIYSENKNCRALVHWKSTKSRPEIGSTESVSILESTMCHTRKVEAVWIITSCVYGSQPAGSDADILQTVILQYLELQA
jgi:hypothetical protein